MTSTGQTERLNSPDAGRPDDAGGPDAAPARASARPPQNAQVFYRKWRPQRFADVVGQEHIAQTLRSAISSDRVSHAYLFCGPRGVGKTSSARILAKALNCLNPSGGEPDDTCDTCIAIREARLLDLIEIDAASNRGIDDIRSLREKVHFAPGTARYKVYIIDEVHMLTPQAFNALLKTLEEPPPHTVMVLATTEVHQVPLTIISRCQRFDFRRISNEHVIDRLAELCGAEEIDCAPEVLAVIARAAWGSLRDAENILEQLAISYATEGSEITVAQARELLGIGDMTAALAVASAVLKRDVASALRAINEEASRGAELHSLRAGVVDALRAALLVKAGAHEALSHPEEVVAEMSSAANAVRLDAILQALAAFGEAELNRNANTPLSLELAAIKAVMHPPAPASSASGQPPARDAGPPVTSRTPAGPRAAPAAYSPPARSPRAADSQSREAGPTRRELSAAETKWNRVVTALRRTKGRKYVIGALLRNVEVPEPGEGSLVLTFKSGPIQERVEEEMADERVRSEVERAVADAYGVELTVTVGDGQGSSTPKAAASVESPLVRAAMAMGARIIESKDLPAE